MRRTPMRRTGFARKPMSPRKPVVVSPLTRVYGAGTFEARRVSEKHVYIRSEALRVACRELPCQHCGVADGTVVCAHANWAWAGKGMGVKADDNLCAALCFECHGQLDQGSRWTKEMRVRVFLDAHVRTVAELLSRGAWPESVPLPAVASAI